MNVSLTVSTSPVWLDVVETNRKLHSLSRRANSQPRDGICPMSGYTHHEKGYCQNESPNTHQDLAFKSPVTLRGPPNFYPVLESYVLPVLLITSLTQKACQGNSLCGAIYLAEENASIRKLVTKCWTQSSSSENLKAIFKRNRRRQQEDPKLTIPSMVFR